MRISSVIIIGTGLAGSQVAAQLISLSKVKGVGVDKITMISKGSMQDCNSDLAQGGVAVALNEPDADSHFSDTLTAGNSLSDQKTTRILVDEGVEVVKDMIEQGLEVDRDSQGKIELGLEGAHSKKRILHLGGDQSGHIMLQFVQQQSRGQVTVLENSFVSEILVDGNQAYGVRILDETDQESILMADFIILASGGCGQLYTPNANSLMISGDGFAVAKRAGAMLERMSFVQFHPTLLNLAQNDPKCLVSEAIRGEGGVLVNSNGVEYMNGVHPLKSLAPRDVVARENFKQIASGRSIYLDVSNVEGFKTRFPSINSTLEKLHFDVDINKLIPVIPGAHFFIGGVATDEWGKTSVNKLYACGEVASTRVHGSNRLASNSLLECLVFGKRVALDILTALASAPEAKSRSTSLVLTAQRNEVLRPAPRQSSADVAGLNLPELHELQVRAFDSIGIIRERERVLEFVKWLAQYSRNQIVRNRDAMQLENMVELALLISADFLK
ncbi:MAG: FAD-binding protein [Candidatus Ancillula sp.]|jgi:L-aspartate oxidase|nr:FAD-binding protein [Candidatus Ancillula sp.]